MDKKKFNKTIVYVFCFVLIAVAIIVALWLSGALSEYFQKRKEERERQKWQSKTEQSTTAQKVDINGLPSILVTETVQIDVCESDESELADIYNDITTATMTEGIKAASYTASFMVTNSWDGKYQFSVIVNNTSDVDISSWEISIEMPDNCNVESFWCSDCKISNNVLLIKPVDYNSCIKAGDFVDNIGFIMSSPEVFVDFTWNGEGVTKENETTVSAPTSKPTQTPTTNPSDKPTQPPTTAAPYVPPVKEDGTPVDNHGKLSVKGTNLVDAKGNKYQLKGVSTHGIAWFPEFINKDAFKTLRDDWGANTIRLAMYTAEYNGYCTGGNQTELKKKVEEGVKYATELGMYVIIDWHVLNERDPNTYKTQASAFFDDMSKKYANYDNVIYEICNEPNGGVSWSSIKKYADEIIQVIRKNDSDAIILVGTPTWSQDVDQVAANPVKNGYNVMYTLHFYAATHKDAIWSKLKTALNAGTPIFISEFSICDASGNGGIDYNSANSWKSLIKQYNLSYIGWNLSNKAETSSLIKADLKKYSGWTTSELSDTGKWLRDFILGK